MAKSMLHPGAKWQFRINAYFALLFLSIFAVGFGIPFIITLLSVFSGATSGLTSVVILVAILIYIVVIIAISEIYARMAYNRWFYEFTPTNLQIEHGIIWKKYSNIPYERVQNIDIQRGIIARMFGFSTVNIQTAGYSYTRNGAPVSEGYIPAVSIDEAEQIREFLMKRISKRSQGGL